MFAIWDTSELNQRDIGLDAMMMTQSNGIHKASDDIGLSLRSLKKSHRMNEMQMNKAVCLGIVREIIPAIKHIASYLYRSDILVACLYRELKISKQYHPWLIDMCSQVVVHYHNKITA